MARKGFLERHGVVRHAVREDVLSFGIPALVVFFVGLVVSSFDGYDGLVGALWELVKQPRNVALLPVANVVGLVMFVVGLTIALAGAFTLGRFYASTLLTRHDHRLITHGVYRWVRHPIYTGGLLICFGVP